MLDTYYRDFFNLEPASWPSKKEISYLLNVRPWIDLPIDFDHQSCLQEAIRLKELFVVHRELDQTSQNAGKWKSLSIKGAGGDYKKTQAHLEYGLSNDSYQLTEIVQSCPNTMKLLNLVTDVNRCQRIRYMLLEPGAEIKVHTDAPHSFTGLALNISLNWPEKCDFYTDLNSNGSESLFSSRIPAQPGKVFLFNNAQYHRVINHSHEPRYHLIIHGPIRFSDSTILECAYKQLNMKSNKSLLNRAVRRVNHVQKKEVQDLEPQLYADWMQFGISEEIFSEAISILLVDDDLKDSSLMEENRDLISSASLFPFHFDSCCVKDLTTILFEKYRNGKRWAVLIGTGSFVHHLQDFAQKLNIEIARLQEMNCPLAGHIMFWPEGSQLPYLHEQFVIFDLKIWIEKLEGKKIDLPYAKIDSVFSNIGRSKDNIHDDYTPQRLFFSEEAQDISGSNGYFSNIIEKFISHRFNIENLSLNFRGTKSFSYPRAGRKQQYQDIKKEINKRLDLAKNKTFVFNNEPLIISNYNDFKVEKLIGVASGFKPFSLLNQFKKTVSELSFIDFSQRSLNYVLEIMTCHSLEDLVTVIFKYSEIQTDRAVVLHQLRHVLKEGFGNSEKNLIQLFHSSIKKNLFHFDFVSQELNIEEHFLNSKKILFWHSNAWLNNAILYLHTASQLKEKYIEFCKKICLYRRSSLWLHKNRFEAIIGSDLKSPEVILTDGYGSSVINAIHYLKIEL